MCRQDVPALPSGEGPTRCCPRCGETVGPEPQPGDCPDFRVNENGTVPFDTVKGNSPAFRAGENETAPCDAMSRLPTYDGWECDEELQHIGRMLHAGNAAESDSEAIGRRQAARFDLPQDGPPARHGSESGKRGQAPFVRSTRRAVPAKGACPRFPRRGTIPGLLTSFVFTLGLASSACGGILLGWSLAGGGQQFWNVGLPVALVGQIALLAGLVLQVDRLWHDNRAAASKLDDVGQQIHKLKTTTMLLGARHEPASATFYTHLARGAGPQLLLADLKGQLDLLAMKIAEDT